MTTPFGGAGAPVVIDLYRYFGGTNDPFTVPNFTTIASGATMSIQIAEYLDFSLMPRSAYFEVIWGHTNLANAGTSYIQLYDQTNATALATMTTVTTGAITDVHSASTEVGFVSFGKPTSTAKVIVRMFNGDNTGTRQFFPFRAAIVFFQ